MHALNSWIKLLCNLLTEHKELSVNTLILPSARSGYDDGEGRILALHFHCFAVKYGDTLPLPHSLSIPVT